MKTRLRPVQRFLSHPVLMIPMHLWLSDAWLRLGSYHLETMSLKPFTYPFPETRFLHAGPNVYKFKIRYGNSIRGEEIENKDVIIRELEDSIRAVLGNLDNLQPFVTEHFIVFPYKSKWERVSHLKFKHGEIVLLPYPFVFTLYVEMKWFHENLSPGRPINDSPLGLDSGSSLKLLTEKKTAGASVRKRGLVEEPGSPRSTGLRRAKMGTSSQESSKKKPHMETRKNKERKPQQATPDSDTTEAQEQGRTVSEPSRLGNRTKVLSAPRLQNCSSSDSILPHLLWSHGPD
ncbi:membrane-anchored junction protein isoform X4 [Sciurus carolinensis]|uniref:membrane-anchored junction protein isoform X4 n=1 Tax=Sciurus carolinensis TaxID=30640 RepID=UPI001FB37E8E|nr:membrane-anchored junction protein isoform X4 [Sciurus carolinensis]